MQIDFGIQGMTCGSCAARITQTLEKTPGVASVTVNFATRRGRVVGELSRDKISQLLKDIGYTADFGEPDQPSSGAVSGTQPPAEIRGPGSAKEWREFLAAALLSFPVFVLGMFMIEFPGSGWLQFGLTSLVMIVPGRGPFVRALHLLRRGAVNMDTLVATGVGAAWIYSTILVVQGHDGHLWFESAAVVLTLILLGKYLEERAKDAALDAIRGLGRLLPKTARLVRADDTEEDVPLSSLRRGDIFAVRVGEAVPADGLVHKGEASFDESLVTGESVPVLRRTGDEIIAGTINSGPGVIHGLTRGTGKETFLARIVQLIEDAQSTKPAIQKTVDRVSSIFVPIVIALSVITFFAWKFFGNATFFEAFVPAITVLVIACPCALGLATPTALVVGTGVAARSGVLVRSTAGLEWAGRIRTIIMDKTGTFTLGRPEVTDFKVYDASDFVLAHGVMAALERQSQHPVAKALAHWCESKVPALPKLRSTEEVAGSGIKGELMWQGQLVTARAGSVRWLQQSGIQLRSDHSDADGVTTVLLAVDQRIVAKATLVDRPREGAADTARHLRSQGVKVIVATGDSEASARKALAGVDLDGLFAEVKPADKVELVRKARVAGDGFVAMVGDGINDAPALAAADVAIAMGGGTDVAMGAAQLILPSGDIGRLQTAMEVSKFTMRTIQQNLFWAFLYNVIAIPVAALGYLSPMIAAAAMAFSSVSVVGNSLRLKRLAN